MTEKHDPTPDKDDGDDPVPVEEEFDEEPPKIEEIKPRQATAGARTSMPPDPRS